MKVELTSTIDDEARIETHMISPIDGEYTLCGTAFDCSLEFDGIESHNLIGPKIDCQSCIKIIEGCKKVSKKLITK